MRYKFRFRRKWFWKTYEVSGHQYIKEMNKMVLYFPNGGLREIKKWDDCEVKLGPDWFAETKREMENQAGQKIPTKIGG